MTRGGSFTSDIALDEIRVRDVPQQPTTTSQTTTSQTTTGGPALNNFCSFEDGKEDIYIVSLFYVH